MRQSLIDHLAEATCIEEQMDPDARYCGDSEHSDHATVYVDALVEWLRGKHQVEFANGPGEVERGEMTGLLIADLLEEEA